MSIIDTVEDVKDFLDAEETVTLLKDEPSKFMVELKNMLEDIITVADDLDSAISTAIEGIEEARSRAEEAEEAAQDAISELEYVR
jgi:hypothetical protein